MNWRLKQRGRRQAAWKERKGYKWLSDSAGGGGGSMKERSAENRPRPPPTGRPAGRVAVARLLLQGELWQLKPLPISPPPVRRVRRGRAAAARGRLRGIHRKHFEWGYRGVKLERMRRKTHYSHCLLCAVFVSVLKCWPWLEHTTEIQSQRFTEMHSDESHSNQCGLEPIWSHIITAGQQVSRCLYSLIQYIFSLIYIMCVFRRL